MKQIAINVKTFDSDNEVIEVLSISNCAPQQLSSVLSLCKPGMRIEINFVEVDFAPNGMSKES